MQLPQPGVSRPRRRYKRTRLYSNRRTSLAVILEASECLGLMSETHSSGTITVERWEAVKDALDLHRRGLDFADALHWTCCAACERLVSFDRRRFVGRARRPGLVPQVMLPR